MSLSLPESEAIRCCSPMRPARCSLPAGAGRKMTWRFGDNRVTQHYAVMTTGRNGG